MVNQALRMKIAYWSEKKEKEEKKEEKEEKEEKKENTRDRSVPDGSDKKPAQEDSRAFLRLFHC